MSPSSASLKFPQSGFCKMKSDSAVAARGLISRRRRKWRCVPCSTRRATTKCTRSLFKSSRHLERSRRIPVRNLKGNFHGIPRLPLGMTDSADNLEQFFRLRQDELMGICRLGGAINLFARGIESAEKDVVVDGIVKQKRLLGNETDLLAQRSLRQSAQIMTIDSHCARCRIVEPKNERENRALTGAAGTDERITFTRLNAESDVAECVDGRAGVAESDVFEIDSALRSFQGFRVGRVLDSDRSVENSKNAFGGGNRPLHQNP